MGLSGRPCGVLCHLPMDALSNRTERYALCSSVPDWPSRPPRTAGRLTAYRMSRTWKAVLETTCGPLPLLPPCSSLPCPRPASNSESTGTGIARRSLQSRPCRSEAESRYRIPPRPAPCLLKSASSLPTKLTSSELSSSRPRSPLTGSDLSSPGPRLSWVHIGACRKPNTGHA
jgi:hypothetical protein